MEFPVAYENILNELKNQKISHSYLFEMENNEQLKKIISEIMKYYDNNYIYYDFDPNLMIFNEENELIPKEDVLSIIDNFSKQSPNNRPYIYWIKNIDKMTKAAANSLLKFLEEPSKNVIAIFDTKDTSKVIDTIVSRCRVYKITGYNKEKINEKVEIFLNYLLNKIKDIEYSVFLQEEIANRDLTINFFEDLESYVSNQNQNDSTKISNKQIETFLEYKKRLNYNVNLKLFYKSFIIEFKRGNENE